MEKQQHQQPARQPLRFKLEWTLRFGKHKGQTLQYLIENELEYVKYLHRKQIIAFDPIAWDEFMLQAKAADPHKKQTSTFFSRNSKRR